MEQVEQVKTEAKPKAQKCGDFGGKNREGGPCGKAAGWGIPGETSGKCRKCRRYGGGRPPEHGRYMGERTKAQLMESAQRWMDRPDPLNMLEEIALVREILYRTLLRYNVNPDEPGFNLANPPAIALDDAMKLLGAIQILAKIAESQERVRASQVLTDAEALLIMTQIRSHILLMQDFIEFLPEEKRREFTVKANAVIQTQMFPVD